MKKALIGCGVIFVLLAAVVGYFGYRFVKLGMGFVESAKKAGELYVETDRKFPYAAPPESNTMSASQLERWLAVRAPLMGQVESLKQVFEPEGNVKVFGMMSDMAEQIGRTVEIHTEALEAQEMSINEYIWISRRVISALNSGDARADSRLTDMVDSVEQAERQMDNSNQRGAAQALQVPMTSAEINQTLSVLAEHREPFLETKDALFIDLVLPAIQEMIKGQNVRAGGAPVEVEQEEALQQAQ